MSEVKAIRAALLKRLIDAAIRERQQEIAAIGGDAMIAKSSQKDASLPRALAAQATTMASTIQNAMISSMGV